jgi:hypothetical protein
VKPGGEDVETRGEKDATAKLGRAQVGDCGSGKDGGPR